MKKKRILAVILAAAMAFGMTACGGDKPAETTKAAETEAKKAEAESVLKKLLAEGMSADEILAKLK